MFNFKKFIATAVSAAMAFSVMTSAMMTSAFAALPTDIDGAKNYEAIETLNALNIMIGYEDGTFRPDINITRAEFAKIAIHLLGVEDVATGTASFPDVANSHWATGYIKLAADQGIVVGYEDGTFRPDEKISYQEAMTIIVRILGYEPAAKQNGGYPTGYLVIGSQKGISKNVASTNGYATRATLAQIAFNALDVEMMEQSGYGTDITYEVGDKTILADNLNAEKIEGLVTATSDTTLTGTSGLENDELRIDDTVYKTGDNNYDRFLGQYVTAYTQENDANDETDLILVRTNTNKTSTLTISAADIEAFNDGTIQYWKDKNNDTETTDVDVSSSADLIYNGMAEDFGTYYKVPASGKVVLIDNNSDNKYDVVSISESSNLVVEDTSSSSYTITDKYGNASLVLDPDNDNIKFNLMNENGDAVNFSDLKEWDVLTYTKSSDSSLINVVVTNNKVEGKITEIDEDEYTIDGTGYKKAENLTSALNLNDEGTFYLDADGKIAAVDTTSTISNNYAYLMGVDLSTGFDEVAQIKVYTKSGETLELDCATKVDLDETKNLTGAQLVAALTAGQLITYDLNASGKVDEIDTANNLTGSTLTSDEDNFSFNYAQNGAVYKSATNKLGKVKVDSNTIVFDIPASETDSDNYAVKTMSMFANEGSYNVLAYDVTEDLIAKAVIVTNSNGKIEEDSSIAVVSKITTVQNADDEDVQKLYAVQDGKAVSYMTAEADILVKASGALEQGDIIQFSTNTEGEIDSIQVLFDTDAKTTEFTSTSNDTTLVYGKIAQKFSSSINVSVNDGEVDNYSFTGANIYKYDSTKNSNNITIVDSGELQKYDSASPSRVFIRMYDDQVKEIVIVK